MVGKKIYGKSGKVVARKRADYGDPKGTLSYVENGSGANVERLLGPGAFIGTDAGADDRTNDLLRDGGPAGVRGGDSEAGSRRRC